jgi:hypothetical protein
MYLSYSSRLWVWHHAMEALVTQGAHGVRSDFRPEPFPTVLHHVVGMAVVAPY